MHNVILKVATYTGCKTKIYYDNYYTFTSIGYELIVWGRKTTKPFIIKFEITSQTIENWQTITLLGIIKLH